VPEVEFLCYLARPRPDYEGAERLAPALNWTRVYNCAARHGVRPQLLQGLRSFPGQLRSHQIVERLSEFEWAQATRNLSFVQELLRIAEAFEAQAVNFVPFKGAVLVFCLYGDISRREFNDIDILVPKKNLSAAEAVLERLGYKARFGSREYRGAFL